MSTSSWMSRLSIAVSVVALLAVVAVASSKGGGSSGQGVTAAAPVAVALTEFAITPGALTVPKGGSLQVSNGGTMDHTLAVTGTSIKMPALSAGGSATLDVSSLDPGTYELFCDVPGHKDSGMKAKLVVSDGSAGGAATADAETASAAGGHDMANMDISSMNPGDPATKAMNKRMQDAMDNGVQSFLDYAKRYGEGTVKKGNQKIAPEIQPDGTKRFYLTAAITDWEVSPGKIVKAWTYNGQVPGPWLRVEPGDKMEVVLRNELPISTDIHWHGIDVPNDQDGLAPITQSYIEPRKTYTYKFTAPSTPQLGMYHAHMHGQEAIVNGLFAIVQVGDTPLPRGRKVAEVDIPQDLKIAQEIPMVLNDAGVIGLSLNGKAFPATEPIVANKGDWILIHFLNEGLQVHPMHLHRQPQIVVAKDGHALDSPYRMDTVLVAPGERYSVLVKAEDTGTWAFHCHIVSHAESDQGLFGMVTAMIVK
jgi:uncharacterized cupredoxin-like copper-binding protein